MIVIIGFVKLIQKIVRFVLSYYVTPGAEMASNDYLNCERCLTCVKGQDFCEVFVHTLIPDSCTTNGSA